MLHLADLFQSILIPRLYIHSDITYFIFKVLPLMIEFSTNRTHLKSSSDDVRRFSPFFTRPLNVVKRSNDYRCNSSFQNLKLPSLPKSFPLITLMQPRHRSVIPGARAKDCLLLAKYSMQATSNFPSNGQRHCMIILTWDVRLEILISGRIQMSMREQLKPHGLGMRYLSPCHRGLL